MIHVWGIIENLIADGIVGVPAWLWGRRIINREARYRQAERRREDILLELELLHPNWSGLQIRAEWMKQLRAEGL